MMSHDGERASRELAEASRERGRANPSFLRELFLGRLRLDLLRPYPGLDEPPRPEFAAFLQRLERFLREDVDSAEIDRSGEYPEAVIDGLTTLGAFGMKIPTEYGGLGFSHGEYAAVMKLLGSVDGNLTALLSAHQFIGVPQPILLFGTEEQKRRLLPRCAAGAISAFALTEPNGGSDPARPSTTAIPVEGGFVINGEKLWCPNGTIAELLVVMARVASSGKISAFVVETSWPGVRVEHRCRFMGLRALANAQISFRDVHVPVENVIRPEGAGLKITLATLNTGRLAIPAAVVGTAKQCLEISRLWANARERWGAPSGRHQAIAQKLADMAATTFAMEAVSDLASAMADAGTLDIRLEAAAAKEWNTTRGWEIINETLQIRGGRGYETEGSLSGRGEVPIGVERMLRDARINTIFEGSSEIMQLFMAREAVDRHLDVASTLVQDGSPMEKLRAVPGIASFDASWYPRTFVRGSERNAFSDFGPLARHMRFAERSCRKLAREIFHGMAVYKGGLQRKQAFLFRAVDVANELFAMVATLARAERLRDLGAQEAAGASSLADLFCREARRRVNGLFWALWSNDDAVQDRTARAVLAGEHRWLEQGKVGLGLTEEDLVPDAVWAPSSAPHSTDGRGAVPPA